MNIFDIAKTDIAGTDIDRWFSQEVGKIDDYVVSVRVMKNCQANFHEHSDTEELFIVLNGRLIIDLESESIELTTGQMYAVKRGTRHRARASERVELLAILKKG